MRAGYAKDLDALRRSCAKGETKDTQKIRHIPAEGIAVRFLQEPGADWLEYFEHFDKEAKRFVVCTGDGCDFCDSGDSRPSKRTLANVLDIASGEVVALKMPMTVVRTILKKYDRYDTLIDRDYQIDREGTGLNTEYDVTPDAPRPVNTKRYETLDLMALVTSLADETATKPAASIDLEKLPF